MTMTTQKAPTTVPRGARRVAAAALAGSLWLVAAVAAPAADAAAPPLRGARVPDAVLDRVRGGTAAPDGRLVVTFTIARTVSIDGRPVASAMVDAAAAATLVQRGAGSTAAAALTGASLPAIAVQNTLSGGSIQTSTVIDVTTTGRQAFDAMTLQQTLTGAITASLRR